MKISVVVPCYRCEAHLEGVIEEMVSTLEQRPETSFEIILVNDGSDDHSFDVISSLCRDDRIKGIDLSRNFGQPAATMAGLAHASGELIVYSDDDGQTPFHDLWGLVDSLDDETDLVFAQLENRDLSWVRRFGSKSADALANLMIGKPKDIRMGNFWVSRRYVIDQVLEAKTPFPYLGGLLLKTTQKIGGYKTTIRPRRGGFSGYMVRTRLALWLDGATAFSIAPLRVSIFVGLFFGILGLSLATTAVVQWFMNPEIQPGFTSLFATIMFFGGLNLICIGVAGEYIGRLYLNLNGLPQFVVRSKINLDSSLPTRCQEIHTNFGN